MVNPSTMWQISSILAPKWHLLQVTLETQGISLECILEAWMSLEKSPIIYLCERQLILHHLCDYSLLCPPPTQAMAVSPGYCHRIWRAKSIPLQPLAIGSCWKSNEKTVSPTPSYIYHDQHRAACPLCKKVPTRFSWAYSLVPRGRKNLPEDMLSTYHLMAKGDMDAPLTLPTSNMC